MVSYFSLQNKRFFLYQYILRTRTNVYIFTSIYEVPENGKLKMGKAGKWNKILCSKMDKAKTDTMMPNVKLRLLLLNDPYD